MDCEDEEPYDLSLMDDIDSHALFVGQSFSSFEEMKQKILNFCIVRNLEYVVKYARKPRLYVVVCKHPKGDQSLHHCFNSSCDDLNCLHDKTKPKKCTFKISGTYSKKGFTISHLTPNHDCAEQSSWMAKSKVVVKSSYVLDKIADSFTDNTQVKPAEIIARTLREDGVKVSYKTAWRAKRKAKEIFQGDIESSYSKIPSFVQKVNEENGSVAFCEINQDSDLVQRFSRCFICYRACWNALKYCKPLVFFDACHVSNDFNGVILVACSTSGANETVVLAFGLANTKNLANWSWFIHHLKEANPLINDTPFTVISDREKGIQEAARRWFPDCRHCFCVKHIEKNLIKKFGRDGDIVKKMWKAAKVFMESEFQKAMDSISSVKPHAREYLDAIEHSAWANAHASLPKFGCATSNTVESFNGKILHLRSLHHLAIINGISEKVMVSFHDKRNHYNSLAGQGFVKGVENILRNLSRKADKLQVAPSNHSVFKVTSQRTNRMEYIVDLAEKACSCQEFQQNLYPCVHALAALHNNNDYTILSLTHDIYKIETLQKLYADWIRPISINELTFSEGVKPPIRTKQPGRPKKLRIRSSNENDSSITCSRCGLLGHNCTTCEQRGYLPGEFFAAQGTLPQSSQRPRWDAAERLLPQSSQRPRSDAAQGTLPQSSQRPRSDAAERPLPQSSQRPRWDAAQGTLPQSSHQPRSDAAQVTLPQSSQRPRSDAAQGTLPQSSQRPRSDVAQRRIRRSDAAHGSLPQSSGRAHTDVAQGNSQQIGQQARLVGVVGRNQSSQQPCSHSDAAQGNIVQSSRHTSLDIEELINVNPLRRRKTIDLVHSDEEMESIRQILIKRVNSKYAKEQRQTNEEDDDCSTVDDSSDDASMEVPNFWTEQRSATFSKVLGMFYQPYPDSESDQEEENRNESAQNDEMEHK
jgi:MULE transposase domain/SWIM zinc finger